MADNPNIDDAAKDLMNRIHTRLQQAHTNIDIDDFLSQVNQLASQQAKSICFDGLHQCPYRGMLIQNRTLLYALLASILQHVETENLVEESLQRDGILNVENWYEPRQKKAEEFWKQKANEQFPKRETENVKQSWLQRIKKYFGGKT